SSSATVAVTVLNVNRPAAANAGPDQSVLKRSMVTLDGSASADPDGEAVTYNWSQIGGHPGPLSHPSAADPTLPAPLLLLQTLTFQLIACDPHSACGTDTVVVTVTRK